MPPSKTKGAKTPKVAIFGAEVSDLAAFNKGRPWSAVWSTADQGTFDQISTMFIEYKPDVILTIGKGPSHEFQALCEMPVFIRRRWIHFKSLEAIKNGYIINCFLQASFKREEKNPLITIFTTTYKSGERILRPFNSLREQTYKEWEWVIMDDSDDDGETYAALQELAARDFRIRLYRPNRPSGVIGKVKRDVCMLGEGEFLLELDHDDELFPNALELVVRAFQAHPDAGMVYSDYSEVFEDDLRNFNYGENYAFGYGTYTNVLWKGRWVHAARTPRINPQTIRYIVGVPNHLRAWRASYYYSTGGHNVNLPIVDDYELCIRTFLESKMVHIPYCLYIQYRNSGGNNFTFIRNAEIQKITQQTAGYYNEAIHRRLEELGIPDESYPWREFGIAWKQSRVVRGVEMTTVGANDVYLPHPDQVSLVYITHEDREGLERTLRATLKRSGHWRLYVIGHSACKTLPTVIEQDEFKDSRIEWWVVKGDADEARAYAQKMLVATPEMEELD